MAENDNVLRIERWDQRNPASDWWNRVVFLWSAEDTADSYYDETRTQLSPNPHAFGERAQIGVWKAITGGERRPEDIVEKHNMGDTVFTLYQNGFVHSESYAGESIGVVAAVRKVTARDGASTQDRLMNDAYQQSSRNPGPRFQQCDTCFHVIQALSMQVCGEGAVEGEEVDGVPSPPDIVNSKVVEAWLKQGTGKCPGWVARESKVTDGGVR